MAILLLLRPPKVEPAIADLGHDIFITLDMVHEGIGKRIWAIAEGYIPSKSTGPGPEFTSHETVCILNTSDQVAQIEIMIYFTNRDPAGPFKFSVDGRRTRHFRFNDFNDPEVIPRDTDYASVISSSIPIVVQHTRLDSRQAANALLSTIAYPGNL
ncbi:MAG TPA: sensory rhodopsin transducer [Sphingobacteriaceae bacterium]